MRHGVSSRSRRGIGVHGRRAAAPARRRTPRSRSCRSPPTRTWAPRCRSCSRRWLRPTRRSSTRRCTAGDLAGLDVVFLALPHGESQAIVPDRSSTPSATSSTSAPTSGCPRADYEQWYGEAHTAPRAARPVRVRPARAVPRRDRRRPPRRRARLLPDDRVARARAAAARRAGRADGHRGRRASRRVGRGARRSRSRACSRRSNENVAAYGLLTHRHTGGDGAWRSRTSPAQPVQVLFTPHLVPMTRGILATCYARPRPTG